MENIKAWLFKYLIPVGAGLLLILGYELAFENTVDAWRKNQLLKEQAANLGRLDNQPYYLERKGNNLREILSKYKTDTLTSRNAIINKIALIAESGKVKLTEVPVPDPLFHTDKFIIQRLVFEGDFFDLLRILNMLQHTNDIGMLRSASLRTIENDNTNKLQKQIFLEIFLETTR